MILMVVINHLVREPAWGGPQWHVNDLRSGKHTYITMENHHVLWVNQRTKWQFSIAMLNYQRVTRPKNKPSGLKIKHIDPQHKCRRVSVGHVPISPSVQVRSVCWLHHAIFLVGWNNSIGFIIVY